MFCRHRERTRVEEWLCFCRCLWPKTKSKIDVEVVCDDTGRISFKDFLEDDGAFVGFFDRPVRVGASILIYGLREGKWPWHCMAGPDWPGSLLVYFLIIMVHCLVLGLCSTCLGWAVQVVGWLGCIALLVSYTAVAFTNPGIVYKESNIELGEVSSALAIEEGQVDCSGESGIGDESASEDSISASTKQLIAGAIGEGTSTSVKASVSDSKSDTVAQTTRKGLRQTTGAPPTRA